MKKLENCHVEIRKILKSDKLRGVKKYPAQNVEMTQINEEPIREINNTFDGA